MLGGGPCRRRSPREPSGIFDLIDGRSWLLLRLLLMAMGLPPV
jgi:hypothetical protein